MHTKGQLLHHLEQEFYIHLMVFLMLQLLIILHDMKLLLVLQLQLLCADPLRRG